MGERYYIEHVDVDLRELGKATVPMVMMRSNGQESRVIAGRTESQAKAMCIALNNAYTSGLADGIEAMEDKHELQPSE